MPLLTVALILAGSVGAATPLIDSAPQLFHSPTVSETEIAFVYEGHLWIVGRGGGAAKRLTSAEGSEAAPVFSPDGRSLAFAGNYDGNVDVYIVSSSGGEPRRLTWHPGVDVPTGWSHDGRRVLFTSTRNSETGGASARLFSIEADGAFPAELPLPEAYEGVWSPDDRRVAYVPLPRAFAAWRQYRGGQTSPILIADLATSRTKEIPRRNSNDFSPMWVHGRVYFLSDRDGPVALYAFDTASSVVRRVAGGSRDEIISASAGTNAIAFEELGSVHLLDLRTGRITSPRITLRSEHTEASPREIAVADQISNAAVSPTADHVLFEARGEILLLAPATGAVVNLTNSPGTTETQPAWSPDGKWISYFSDETGRYELRLREPASSHTRGIPLGDSAAYFSAPVWSPDSRRLTYTDSRRRLWYVDLASGTRVRIAVSENARRETEFGAAWSPDGRYLAYTTPLKSWYRALYVYSVDDGANHQITDGVSDAGQPVFDPGGRYLYFTASVDQGPSMSSFDLSSSTRRATRSVFAFVLNNGVRPPGAADTTNALLPSSSIAFEHPERRIVGIPLPARAYVALAAIDHDVLYALESTPAGAGPLSRIDLRAQKLDRITASADRFLVSADSRKLLWWQGTDYWLVATDQRITPASARLSLDALKVTTDPRREWREGYFEVWRAEREFFYDAKYHGVDLRAVEAKYAPFLDSLSSRNDLNFLFQRMLGELQVSHVQVRGGAAPRAAARPTGLLGADYAVEQGRYRIVKIFRGDPWSPAVRAPLAVPGNSVNDGEFLLAVNGRELRSADNIYKAFQGLANRPVTIRVGPNADGSQARDMSVVPVGSESRLRYVNWVETNRQTVARLSGGRIGYVHIPDTGVEGLTAFDRYFFPQSDKPGMIIDARFNRGGAEADYLIDYLSRPTELYEAVRIGDDYRVPFAARPAAEAMLINERTGSGGEGLAWMFQTRRLGPVIGKRTWGGAVGLDGFGLNDGGEVTIPTHRSYAPDGRWIIENHGVSPDIEVDLDPAAWRSGHDAQLERAVKELLGRLRASPPRETKHRQP